jgi:hypothetical protein
MDYLPRRLITPELLRASISLCLEQRPERDAAAAAPPAVAPATAAKSLPRELIPRRSDVLVNRHAPRCTWRERGPEPQCRAQGESPVGDGRGAVLAEYAAIARCAIHR